MKAENPVLGAHFLPCQRFYRTDCFQKQPVNPHQPCELYENWFKTAIYTGTVKIIISWKPKSVIFKCKLKNTYEVLLLESILIPKKNLWRINFVLIKLSLIALLFRNHGMNVKVHYFSIRLCLLSRTMVQRKYGVDFLHSWHGTIEGFDFGHGNKHSHHGVEWLSFRC